MMTSDQIEISNLNRVELQDLQKRIEKRLIAIEKEERKSALAAAEAAAREAGFSLEELMGAAPRATRAKAPAKYRDPVSGKTWSGRGRRPAWIKDAGDDLSRFEI